MRQNKVKTILLGMFALGFAALLVVSLAKITSITFESKESAEMYKDLHRFVGTTSPSITVLREESGEMPGEAQVQISLPQVDFAALQEQNAEITGWLILEDSSINHPVVQGANNAFYLKHLFDGTQNVNGTLFTDYRNARDFSDRHTIIYGHRMKNGSMFTPLLNYADQSFYEAHPRLLLVTPEGGYMVELFSAYTTDVHADSWQRNFADDADFTEWIQAAKDRSDFTSDVEVQTSDRLLTLSTCSSAFQNARYVVVGKLVEVG